MGGDSSGSHRACSSRGSNKVKNAMSASDGKKLCFVVSPIGKPGSESRKHADWVLEYIIKPEMVHHPEFEVKRADDDFRFGQIDVHIINDLLDAELVIADLSLRNPNVFYEVGIRHMREKPIIHLQLESEEPIFDVAGYRSVKLALSTTQEIEKSRTQLKEHLIAVFDQNFIVTNPGKNARGILKMNQEATPADLLIRSEISELRERIENIEFAVRQANVSGFTGLIGARSGFALGDLGLGKTKVAGTTLNSIPDDVKKT
jgi:hypothetical protein